MLLDPSLLSVRSLDSHASVSATDLAAGQTLESRFMNAVANLSADFEAGRAGITAAVSRFDPSNSESAMDLQNRLAVYGIDVGMASSLARKSVAAVEALLR